MRTPALLLVAGLTLSAAPALSQQPAHGADHPMHMGGPYSSAMMQMRQAMMQADDTDADRAFALKMIEHHRGGVAMVDVLMKQGDDAELKRMAAKTKAMQQQEIGELQAWLDRHGGRAAKK